MFNRDHEPPHVHLRAGGRKGKVDIRSGEVLAGAAQFNRAQLKRVGEYVEAHRDGLLAAWEETSNGRPLSDHGL